MESGLSLYQKYHIDREDDRLGLFELVAENFAVSSMMYPGCFVHLTPALVFSVSVFVDTDQRADSFFKEKVVQKFIQDIRKYACVSEVRFLNSDNREKIPLEENSFDLLISQYAGFISVYCSRYLKIGGLLLANNSHGTASMASIDPNYRCIGVIERYGSKYCLKSENLEDFLTPKNGKPIIRERLLQVGRGVAFKKSASNFLFQRIS